MAFSPRQSFRSLINPNYLPPTENKTQSQFSSIWGQHYGKQGLHHGGHSPQSIAPSQRRQALLAQRTQPSAKRFHFFEKVECERCSGAVNPQITLQCQGNPGPAQAGAAKTPAARFAADGLDDAFVHQLEQLFGAQLASTAKFGKRELDLILEHLAR
jgi:hypothetical protein